MLDEPTARAIAIIISVLGGPALLISFGRTVWKWWTGRAAREREHNGDLVQQRDQADADRRKALEYASMLRRQLNEAGLRPEPWPADLRSTPKPRPRSNRSTPPKENQ